MVPGCWHGLENWDRENGRRLERNYGDERTSNGPGNALCEPHSGVCRWEWQLLRSHNYAPHEPVEYAAHPI